MNAVQPATASNTSASCDAQTGRARVWPMLRRVRHAQARYVGGFTLLEIMVVVVLIGITVTLVALSFNRDVDRVAQLEAERFAALLDLVRDESILSGQTFAIEVDEAERTYRFLRADGKWVPVTGDSLLRPRTLPEFLNLRLDLPERSAKRAEPRVVVQALGDVMPFVLTIIGERSDYRVTIDSGQNLTIKKHDHETG